MQVQAASPRAVNTRLSPDLVVTQVELSERASDEGSCSQGPHITNAVVEEPQLGNLQPLLHASVP